MAPSFVAQHNLRCERRPTRGPSVLFSSPSPFACHLCCPAVGKTRRILPLSSRYPVGGGASEEGPLLPPVRCASRCLAAHAAMYAQASSGFSRRTSATSRSRMPRTLCECRYA
ncbi:uncharacterized protein Tco025E_08812 [Trypanosoma conorhini]|uniref:Uncharacterized protein n=1 Tax=Trypanosoma conorhini TaxID=83891 RepID=A0A3R7LNH3_9TRYP|nr:uncharacterized protein Tco025E_08812 [Trypanosoma conorhini]RNF00367.1 hypothetical protein Tco025E_08812 [Trypanosoma conorhini]